MQQKAFDELARSLGAGTSRRAALGLAAALGVGGLALPAEDASARKHSSGKRKKKRFCLNGNQVKARHKKKRRRLRRQGAVRGKCAPCTPVCPGDGACGMDDGCGGTCGCAGGSVCVAGVCIACTVTCTSDAATCGADLQTALTAGGTVFVCPGRYSTALGFTAATGTNVYGAGSGGDEASNTILDAQNNAVTTLTVESNARTVITGVRITGGNAAGIGGLDANGAGAGLLIERCAIVENTGGVFGGMQMVGNVDLVNVTVSGNTGTTGTGGVYYRAYLASEAGTITNSVIDGNSGVDFGGLVAFGPSGSSLAIDGATRITNNTFSATSGERAGGIGVPGITSVAVTVDGTTISGNDTPQCLNVTGCSV
ncbi:MAG: hypothetical protein QM692_17050 [Thermomicrobiales bacterium]